MNYNKRFSELSGKEQNIIIESQYKKLCDEESLFLSRLDFNFSKAIDDELVQLLKKINKIEHASSIDTATNTSSNDKNVTDRNNSDEDKKETQITKKNHLLDVTLNAVIEAFENSPPEFAAAPKIFLNRPLPDSFRPHVWNASLLLSLQNKDQVIDLDSLPAVLDEVTSRRCYALLDKHYEKISSKWLAGLIAETLIKFMHLNNIQLPKNDTDCDNVDHLFFW